MHTALEIYGVGAEENLLHERAAALTKFAVGESASSGGTHSTGATTQLPLTALTKSAVAAPFAFLFPVYN